MKNNKGSVIKINNRSFYKIVISLFVFLTIFIFMSYSATAGDSSYIPAAPTGPENGFLDIEYEYTIYTTSSDALWMFDWGNGSSSDWITLADSENSISKSHIWSSSGSYQVKVKFQNEFFPDGVWSESLTVTITEYYEDDFPNAPSAPLGKVVGCMGVEYSYSTLAIDPKDNFVQYRFDWGDGSISEWTSLARSGSTLQSSHSWEDPGEYIVKSQSRDQYRLTSSWSEPSNVTIESDSDNDKLSDNVEANLGSDPSDSTDVSIVAINSVNHYIVSTQQNVIFYNSTTENTSAIRTESDGKYLIDDDKDGRWNYVYDPSSGTIEEYIQTTEGLLFEIPWYLLLIIGIIVGIVLILFILIKTGHIYLYEEYVAEE